MQVGKPFASDIVSLKLYWPTIQRIVRWHVQQTAKLGVPYKLETTYDQLDFTKDDASSYATVFHLVAMKACIEVARVMNDTETESLCSKSLNNTRKAFDLLQWSIDHYAAVSNNCSKNTCQEQIGVFSDTFYPQVLAFTLGLGSLIDENRLRSHLNVTATNNCAFPNGKGDIIPGKCPHGLITLTGRKPSNTDWEIWQMINHDFAVLSLHLNASIQDSLLYSQRSATTWSKVVNDAWGVAALSDANGLPTCINHYGYHMTSWHIPLALSGQNARLFPPDSASLTFTINLANNESSWSFPVYLPGRLGSIQCFDEKFIFSLSFGNLSLKTLSINGCHFPSQSNLVHIHPNKSLFWDVCK
jgi:non-lysosomal glucosylceramidase